MMHAPPPYLSTFRSPYLSQLGSKLTLLLGDLGVAIEVSEFVFVAGWITHADKVDINFVPKTN